MIETNNKYSLFQYGTDSNEESCMLLSRMLFVHREKEQQISDQIQDLYVNNLNICTSMLS